MDFASKSPQITIKAGFFEFTIFTIRANFFRSTNFVPR